MQSAVQRALHCQRTFGSQLLAERDWHCGDALISLRSEPSYAEMSASAWRQLMLGMAVSIFTRTAARTARTALLTRKVYGEEPSKIAFSAAVAVSEKSRGFHSDLPQSVGSRSSSFVSTRVSSATHQPNFTPLAMTPP